MPDHHVSLLTRDGATIEIDCATGSYVLDAAEASGYFLPAMCHQGTCGLCHARVTTGRYEMTSHSAALPAGGNQVLLCRCSPREDLTVELPCDEGQILRRRSPVRQAVVESLRPAWAGAMSLTLQLEADPEFGVSADFIPGQYMELGIPGTDILRPYSLVNLPNWDGRLEFLIRLQPGGSFSTWLSTQAQTGDTVLVRGPAGVFNLDESSPRARCFVGGGCGLAPILSMLRHLGEFQDGQPVHLIFGANQPAELLPQSEIDSLQAMIPQLTVTLAVRNSGPDWTGFVGTSADALDAYLAACPEEPDIYTCGPPKMLEAVQGVSQRRGLTRPVIAERL